VEGSQENKTGQETFSPLITSQGTWARSNVAIAEDLANVFRPHLSEDECKEEEALIQLVETSTNSNCQSNL
jgi:hypothetical protein